MHHNMPKLVRETESLPVSRHIAVQKDARRHVRHLYGEAIHFKCSEVAMDNNAPRSLHP